MNTMSAMVASPIPSPTPSPILSPVPSPRDCESGHTHGEAEGDPTPDVVLVVDVDVTLVALLASEFVGLIIQYSFMASASLRTPFNEV